MKKYAVFPGFIESKNDGDLHWISAHQLMKLYKVPPHKCVIVDYYHHPEDLHKNIKGLIRLSPRFHGNYDLPKSQ